jgi:hypothetical protein
MGEQHTASTPARAKPRDVLGRQVSHVGERRRFGERAFADEKVGTFRNFRQVPADDGGCEWNPAAFSPRTQFIYYGTRYEPTTFQTHSGNRTLINGLHLGSTFVNRVPIEADLEGADPRRYRRWYEHWTHLRTPSLCLELLSGA